MPIYKLNMTRRKVQRTPEEEEIFQHQKRARITANQRARRAAKRTKCLKIHDIQGSIIHDKPLEIVQSMECQLSMEETIKVESAPTNHLPECKKEEVKDEPYEEIDVKDEFIVDEDLEHDETEDACEPLASVTLTPSEDVVVAEGQLLVDPLADARTMRHEMATERSCQGQNRFACDLCYKTFRQSLMLLVHKRSHSRDLLYTCDVCQKMFRSMRELVIHSRTHTGEKPYVCDTCGKRFADPSTFRKHKSIHSGIKSYVCVTCNKGFITASRLRKHERIHWKPKL